jgi:hypothetical protein
MKRCDACISCSCFVIVLSVVDCGLWVVGCGLWVVGWREEIAEIVSNRSRLSPLKTKAAHEAALPLPITSDVTGLAPACLLNGQEEHVDVAEGVHLVSWLAYA